MTCGLATLTAAVVLASTGCATYLTAASDYAASGRHELAVHYYAGHHRSQPDDASRAELVRGVEAAIGSIEAACDSLVSQGKLTAALGAATRLADLIDLARGLSLSEFEAIDAGRRVREVLPRAAGQAVRAVDEAEASGRSAREQTALLRKALSLDPHNPELAARYQRQRSGQKLNLAPRPGCDPAHAAACLRFLDLLTAHMSAERREFTQLVPEGSDKRDAELITVVRITRQDSQWKKVRSGEAEGKVEIRDRFREVRRDAEGEKLTRKVRARYTLYERVASATVTVEVQIRDLRPGRGLTFDTERTASETDRRTYLIWEGDERALGDLMRHGTDRSPPEDPDRLARDAMRKLAGPLARQALDRLEGTRP